MLVRSPPRSPLSQFSLLDSLQLFRFFLLFSFLKHVLFIHPPPLLPLSFLSPQNYPELRAQRGVRGALVRGVRHQQGTPEPARRHHGVAVHVAPGRQRPDPGPVAGDQPQAAGRAGGHAAQEHHPEGTELAAGREWGK